MPVPVQICELEVVVAPPATSASSVAVGAGDGSVGPDAVQAASDSAATNDQAAILLTTGLRIARFVRGAP